MRWDYLNEALMIIGVSFIIMPFVSAFGVVMFYRHINVREINLIKNGMLGEAEIISREQTGTYF